MPDRFDRFLPLFGLLAGLLFFAGLILLRNDPPSETAGAETFSYWQDNRGQHPTFALIGMLEAAMTNAAHEGESPSRLHAQSAPLIRLAGMERGLCGRTPRNRPRRAPQSDAARTGCLGDNRYGSSAPHAGRFLRVHRPSALADRGRSTAKPGQDHLTRTIANAV